MTLNRTVQVGFSRLLVLVPVTVCVSISYVNEQQRCRTLPPQTLAKCRYDDNCMPNAYCWNQEACLCKDDYIVYKNRTHVECLKVATAIGDPCKADVQCRITFAPYSECRQNICQCTDGSHYEGGRCYESIGLGKECQTHHNCYIKDSYCVTGFCACNLKYHPNPRNDGCIPSAELGDKCANDYECVTENSRCIGNCTCKEENYVLSRDRKRCLKIADSVGDSCQEDIQCQLFLKDAECGSNGKCNCIENFHRRGSACFRDTMLNDHCVSHMECITKTYINSNSTEVMNVNCVKGICACAEDYIMTKELHDCVRYSENAAASTTRLQQILPYFILLASVSIV